MTERPVDAISVHPKRRETLCLCSFDAELPEQDTSGWEDDETDDAVVAKHLEGPASGEGFETLQLIHLRTPPGAGNFLDVDGLSIAQEIEHR